MFLFALSPAAIPIALTPADQKVLHSLFDRVELQRIESAQSVVAFELLGILDRCESVSVREADLLAVLDALVHRPEVLDGAALLARASSQPGVRALVDQLSRYFPWPALLGAAPGAIVLHGAALLAEFMRCLPEVTSASAPAPEPVTVEALRSYFEALQYPPSATPPVIASALLDMSRITVTSLAFAAHVEAPATFNPWMLARLAKVYHDGAFAMLKMLAIESPRVSTDVLPVHERFDVAAIDADWRATRATWASLPLVDELPHDA